MRIMLTLLLFLLAACTSDPKIIEKPVYLTRPAPVLPTAEPINQEPVEWTVITEDNWDDIVKKYETKKDRIVFFAVSPEGYETMSVDMAELRRYIQQQNSIIAAYRAYVDAPVLPPATENPPEPPKAAWWRIW